MKKFNKDKYLKKLKFKKYKRYIYIGLPCLLVFFLGIYFTYSKFSVSKDTEVVRTTVGDFIQGDIVIGAYLDGEYSKTIPGKNDGYIVDKIVCDNDASASWDSDSWGILVSNLTKRTKCNVYFHRNYLAPIIAQLDTTGKCPSVNDDGSVSVTGVESTDGYLCKAKDAYGDSYYYRGNVTNNYVKFADKYWRIVRINGNGTVRVIYDGTSAHANGESSDDRRIGMWSFNNISNDNVYVGYMYGKARASTYSETHSNTNNSTIKTYLYDWYKTNILDTVNEQYLTDNIYCNDRSISSSIPNSKYNNLGYGTNATAYRWYYGPWSDEGYNTSMKLICPQQNDAFTVSDTVYGNGALTYPIGLITTDEVVLAGGWNVLNNGYYLYSGSWYWNLSPSSFYGGDANACFVGFNGIVSCGSDVRDYEGSVRPVLNLSQEVLKNGDGSMSNPYHP